MGHLLPLLQLLAFSRACLAQAIPASNYSLWMASSIISRNEGIITGKGGSSEPLQAGFTQKAFRRVIDQYPYHSFTPVAEDYIQTSLDSASRALGNATANSFLPLDRLSNGNNLVISYEATGNETQHSTAQALRKSIDLQRRNPVNGYWYYVYPEWSYLDGLYSLGPFYALFTKQYDPSNKTAIQDILYQFDLLWNHCFDNSTSLLVHGYDYSKTAVWANPVTGGSPHVWGRSLGWYMMALVDTLEILPVSHQSQEWKQLKSKFERLSSAVVKAVDSASGAWWQLLDQPGRSGNYIESSGSAMFVYSLFKGLRLQYITGYENVAATAYEYIVNNFVVDNGNGTLGYNQTVAVCSLNSTASYEYYTTQPIHYNSVLGSAAFVLASLEYEIFKAPVNNL